MEYLFAVYSVFSFSHSEVDILLQTQCLSLNFDAKIYLNQYLTSKSRGHCDNIKVFNQGKSNQIREKSGNLIAKNVWPPCNGMDMWNAPMEQSRQPLTYRLMESLGLGGPK